MPNIRVMHFGLGPIGAAVARQLASRPGFKIVGAVDTDPSMTGRDVGDVIDLGRRLGLRVDGDAARAVKAAKPHVVVHCTDSSIKKAVADFEVILRAKAAVISTTEELAYPDTHIRQARQIHALAKKTKVAVLGTRSIPGSQWTLPIVAHRRLRASIASRSAASRCALRRLPFQRRSARASLPNSSRRRRTKDWCGMSVDRIDRDARRRARLNA